VERFKAWCKTHKKPLIIVGSILAAALIAVASFFILVAINSRPVTAPTADLEPEQPAPQPEPIHYYSKLGGQELPSELPENTNVTAVMMENTPMARPQSGLKNAEVIFESIAEYEVTRFIALYQANKPELIGPVRSLRMHYLDWVTAFSPSIAHIGGSKASLDEVRNGKYKDIDQFFNGSYYWRASDRSAPHNVYTSFKNLDELNQSKGYLTSDFTAFPRKEDATELGHVKKITVDITTDNYDLVYNYNAESNSWDRNYGNGKPHLDREAGQISPKVVIILKVNEKTVMEDGKREQITTTGDGEALIFQDGKMENCKWQKLSRTAQIEFYDMDGNQIALNRGQTWITAIPKTKTVVYE
jgi:hypothetical protein